MRRLCSACGLCRKMHKNGFSAGKYEGGSAAAQRGGRRFLCVFAPCRTSNGKDDFKNERKESCKSAGGQCAALFVPQRQEQPLLRVHGCAQHGADGKACTVCRVWAPNAKAVPITGDFCEWDTDRYPLTKIDDAVWEGYTDEPLEAFDVYKLAITATERHGCKVRPVCVPRGDAPGHRFPLLRHFGVRLERRRVV